MVRGRSSVLTSMAKLVTPKSTNLATPYRYRARDRVAIVLLATTVLHQTQAIPHIRTCDSTRNTGGRRRQLRRRRGHTHLGCRQRQRINDHPLRIPTRRRNRVRYRHLRWHPPPPPSPASPTAHLRLPDPCQRHRRKRLVDHHPKHRATHFDNDGAATTTTSTTAPPTTTVPPRRPSGIVEDVPVEVASRRCVDARQGYEWLSASEFCPDAQMTPSSS